MIINQKSKQKSEQKSADKKMPERFADRIGQYQKQRGDYMTQEKLNQYLRSVPKNTGSIQAYENAKSWLDRNCTLSHTDRDRVIRKITAHIGV